MISKYIDNKILVIEYPSNKELNLSFYRIDTSWEGHPDLVGRKFSCDEFLDLYSDENGNFNIQGYEIDGVPMSYFQYWDGTNISVKDFNKFLKLFKKDLSNREIIIKNLASSLPCNGYIITFTTGGLLSTKNHEYAHAFSYVYPDYKQRVQVVVDSLTPEIKAKFISGLEGMGYNPAVYNDELQAYLVGYGQPEFSSYFPMLTPEEVEPYHNQIMVVFNEYANKYHI